MREPWTTSLVINSEVLLYPACLPFSAIELDLDGAVHTTQRNVQLLGSIIQFNMCVLSAEGIYIILHFIHSSHAWVSGCLLVVDISPAIIKSIAPYPCPFHWYHICLLSFHQLVLNFHWCNTDNHHLLPLTGQTFSLFWIHSAYHVIQCLAMFLVGLPSLNWLYGDMTCLQCSVMVVWQNS